MKLLRLSIALLPCTWFAACGNGNTVPEQPPSAIDDFASRYAEATCNAMPDCCKTGEFDYDADRCKTATAVVMSGSIYNALATLKVHFDQAAAENCLAVRVELYRSCKGDGQAELAACNAILAGEVPVGSPCSSVFECTKVSDMTVTCAPDAMGSTKSHCAAMPPTPVGKSGDACSATCRTSPTDGCTTIDGAPSAAACLVADGLMCDPALHTCAAAPQIGETCDPFCVAGAYCDASKRCQAKTADGSCTDTPDACVDASICACGEATCDPAKKVCVGRGGPKAQCLTDAQCSSSLCVGGFCRVKTPVSQALCEGDL
jgi:hypothetical protein